MAYGNNSYGSPSMEIGIALVLQDRFSNQAREASSVIRRLHREANDAITRNLDTARGIASGINTAANVAVGMMADAVTTGATFIDTMTTVEAITQATQSQMVGLKSVAKDLNLRTMFDAREIASGMQYLSMAGADVAEINDQIEGAALAAAATGMALGGKGGAADLITNVMRTFSLEGKEAANMVSDSLVKATLSSNVSMTDLAESIKYAGANMVMLNKGLPETAALIGTLGNAGIQGSMAGTAIANMAQFFTRAITGSSTKGAAALKSMGISISDVTDANGDLLDFSIILAKIKDGLSDLSTPNRNAIMRDIFGQRGQRAGVALMNNLEGYAELLDKIQNSAGTSNSIVEKRMSSLAGTIDILKSSWETLKVAFAEAIAPVLVPILKTVTSIVTIIGNIFESPVGPFIAAITALVVLFAKLAAGVTLLRVGWLQFSQGGLVSARSMFSILTSGWNGAAISAARYQAIQQAILAQQKMGIVSNNLGRTAALTQSMLNGNNVGGYTAFMTRGGIRYRDVATGRIVRSATAATAVNNIASSAVSTSAALAGGTLAGGIGRGLLAVGRGIMGFLGGPIGIAITAGSILIPLLISAIKGNKESTDNNTDAINRSITRKEEEEAKKKAAEEAKRRTELELLNSIAKYVATIATKGLPVTGSVKVPVQLPDGSTTVVEVPVTNDSGLDTGTK